MQCTSKVFFSAVLTVLAGLPVLAEIVHEPRNLKELAAPAGFAVSNAPPAPPVYAWDASKSQGISTFRDEIFTGGGCVTVLLYDNIVQRVAVRRDTKRPEKAVPNGVSVWCVDSHPNLGGIDASLVVGYNTTFGDTGNESAFLVLG
jgi:hypothetical protein